MHRSYWTQAESILSENKKKSEYVENIIFEMYYHGYEEHDFLNESLVESCEDLTISEILNNYFYFGMSKKGEEYWFDKHTRSYNI